MIANHAILRKFRTPKNLSEEGFRLFSCLSFGFTHSHKKQSCNTERFWDSTLPYLLDVILLALQQSYCLLNLVFNRKVPDSLPGTGWTPAPPFLSNIERNSPRTQISGIPPKKLVIAMIASPHDTPSCVWWWQVKRFIPMLWCSPRRG